MRVITSMSVTPDVALVTLSKAPAGSAFVSRLFQALTELGVNVDTRVAKAGINVDMISQTALTGPYVALNFTASGDDIGKIMEIAARIREKHPTVKLLVSSNNVKISLYGEKMPEHAGIASGVFDVISHCEADILLITTSSVDISILVDGALADECTAALKEKYNL